MKSTGVVRKVDELGRVVIPIELRRLMDMQIKEDIEMYTQDDTVVLKKYEPHLQCMVTGEVSKDNMVLADGKIVLSPEGAKQLMQALQDDQ